MYDHTRTGQDTLTAPRVREAWIVSACTRAREGLAAALRDVRTPWRTTVALSGLESPQVVADVYRACPPDVIVVWLPSLADRQRALVRQLTGMLRCRAVLPDIVVLGEGPLYWFWLALMREVRHPSLSASLRLLDARISVASLQRHLARPAGIPLMKMRFPAVRRDVLPDPLTAGEWRALRASLSGATMAELGARLGVSAKTLYAQRYQALMKLGLEPPASDFWLWHLTRLHAGYGSGPAREGPFPDGQ